jgi:hypothetical protein
VKFFAMPNYTYLKLKIPSPKGVITMGTTTNVMSSAFNSL